MGNSETNVKYYAAFTEREWKILELGIRKLAAAPTHNVEERPISIEDMVELYKKLPPTVQKVR